MQASKLSNSAEKPNWQPLSLLRSRIAAASARTHFLNASNPSHPSLRSITFTGEFTNSPERWHRRRPHRREQLLPVLSSAPPSRPNTQSGSHPRPYSCTPPAQEPPNAPGHQRTSSLSRCRPLAQTGHCPQPTVTGSPLPAPLLQPSG